MSIFADVIVIGAGAAGLMCAIEAGKRGRKVLVLERSTKVGNKILISGGGRCNFTNLDIHPHCFLSENPDFCRSALSRYTQFDFIQLVKKYSIDYYEKKKGQLFCKKSSKQILDMLLGECRNASVEIKCGEMIANIDKNDYFSVITQREEYQCESLVVASGGISIPQMGATGFGYDVAKQFGLNVITPRPGLVPILWNENDEKHYVSLAGISLPVSVSIGAISFSDDLLFTHTGLSGPAILQISSYWDSVSPFSVDLTAKSSGNTLHIESLKRDGTVSSLLLKYLPKRMAELWKDDLSLKQSLSQSSNDDLIKLGLSLTDWQVMPRTTAGFTKAEVTAGGVDTKELSSKTMQARSIPGLFFIGEVVDVTGWLGGYNFQWAWSSGWAAGQAV
ncbi:MAG TPA: NAD(P)/FAD-dependent oxidoreductase [Candidatus Kapabacteria bacterium]|nr:NAD(P)/FAD-dependent oxidoreductase [Candidatus Kapabacteria bacterium]